MAHRILKIGSIIVGGLLAAGGGAVGSHFAEPILEKNFYPQRLRAEEKLKKSVQSKNNQINTQKDQIKNLSQRLLAKDKELSSTKLSIDEDQKKIEKLTQESSEKDSQITSVKSEISDIENVFNPLNRRVNLKKEDILVEGYVDMDLLNVELQEIKWKSFDGDWAEFETVTNKKQTVFKVKKDNFPNYEEVAQKIKEKGINISVHSDFQKWDKEITLRIYEADYSWTTTDVTGKRSFVINEHSHVFNIKTFFKEEYWIEAFKVFIAIVNLDSLPIVHDTSGSSDKLKLFESPHNNISIKFSEHVEQYWKGFTDTKDKFKAETISFKSKEDFIKYWIRKTIYFIRYGRVDLLDMLNPIVKSKYYTKP